MEPADYKPFAPEVHDYVGGRMSAEDERDFERRLGSNTELKQQVDLLRRSLELLHTLPVQEPREGFDARVIGRIREEELADRARKQIASAPVPLWQHVVQVGLGAAAAALVLALVGVPGVFQDDPTNLPGTGGGETVARVAATEDDLLPALADQHARFESLRHSVQHTQLNDPDLQRQVVSMELQYSDLARRNRWLSDQVSDLPPATRAEYQRFLDSLEAALTKLSAELAESGTARRPLDMNSVNKALAQVPTLQGEVANYRLSANNGSLVPDEALMPAGSGKLTEVSLFLLVRRADYRHDYLALIDSADVYLSKFPSGFFEDQAHAARITANMRLGNDETAGKIFAEEFGYYDEDLEPGQLELIKGALTKPEFERLEAARKALR